MNWLRPGLRIMRHFRPEEFDCHDGTDYPAEWISTRLADLVETLDVIREAWGGPLSVVSGYRSPAWNERVGGAKASQHAEGRAADIRPRPQLDENYADTVMRLHALILELYRTRKLPLLGGLGVYPRWVHVDCRERPADGHLARWRGAGVGSES